MRRLLILLPVLLLCSVGLAGCGSGGEGPTLRERAQQVREDAKQLREDSRELRKDLKARVLKRTERVRARARRVGDELAAKVRKALDDLERSVPRADEQTRPPSSAGRASTAKIDDFLTETLRSIDSYWSKTFAANELEEPSVKYSWVPPGEEVRSACNGQPADDTAAFYCPADDTIYVGRRLATGVLEGTLEGLPGEGRAIGDFGVAYMVAHEYAHNLQQELGFFSSARAGASARPFELQADCMAGVWGASVYREGLLTDDDVQEALSTTLAVGDFEVGSPQHHGTPEERRDAWQLGFESGEPSVCTEFVRA
ncbi:neutral zinc metallopeptidase [Paraconexibacter sp. AEG42_29]|uniref:neutral zinc metallopeptidase n=1 Tax=Paraconexibacter sp. AEG42_29 TaxID=2997339 RepID=UPI00339D4B94